MRSVLQIGVLLLLVFVFSVFLISAVLKFWLLNYSFLTATLTKHNSYSELSDAAKISLVVQVSEGGGKSDDVAILTDLINTQNTMEFVNRNLSNTVNFINGKSEEFKVYIPVSKIPKDMVPKNIADINEEMTVDSLAQRLNISGLENIPFQSLSKLGQTVYYILLLSSVLLVTFLAVLTILVKSGRRLIAPAIFFFAASGITFFISLTLKNLINFFEQSVNVSTTLNNAILKTLIPPIIQELNMPLIILGFILAFTGALFVLMKKPGGNSSAIPLSS